MLILYINVNKYAYLCEITPFLHLITPNFYSVKGAPRNCWHALNSHA